MVYAASGREVNAELLALGPREKPKALRADLLFCAAYLRCGLPIRFMRHVADIPYPQVKITLFAWNGKYLLKLEQGPLEQTYKVPELDMLGQVPPDIEIRQLLDEEFLRAAVARFHPMQDDLRAALGRHEAR